MKRNNWVILDGAFRLTEKVEAIALGDLTVQARHAFLLTDLPALGGAHRLLLTGNPIREAAAFVEAHRQLNPEEELEATVHGWLDTREVDGWLMSTPQLTDLREALAAGSLAGAQKLLTGAQPQRVAAACVQVDRMSFHTFKAVRSLARQLLEKPVSQKPQRIRKP